MDDVESIACASYTHARRHPMVLGRVAGWTPPFQLSVTQLVVLVGGFVVLNVARWLWAPLTPAGMRGPLLLLVPCVAAWAVRRVRVEGRSLPRTALGWLSLWCAPTHGRVAGRPQRRTRPIRWHGDVVVVAERTP